MSEKRVAQVLVGSAVDGSSAAILDGAWTGPAANIGEATNVAIMVKADGAVTFTVQAADDLRRPAISR